MQTRSQTRHLSNIAGSNDPGPARTTRSKTQPSPTSQEEFTILDTEFAEYDSSSDYNPEEEEDVLSVDLDFDEASTAWRQNKVSTGNGCYQYRKNAFAVLTPETNAKKARHAKIHPEISTTRMVLRSRG
jgi:hypothetical protein